MVVIATMILPSCSSPRPPQAGGPGLSPCRSAPNCVASDARDERHAIAPLSFQSAGADSWSQVRAAVLSLRRSRLVEERAHYLRVECRSSLFGFVDDLELELRPNDHLIAVRSAARRGYYDFGVNRRRVEKLRELLRKPAPKS